MKEKWKAKFGKRKKVRWVWDEAKEAVPSFPYLAAATILATGLLIHWRNWLCRQEVVWKVALVAGVALACLVQRATGTGNRRAGFLFFLCMGLGFLAKGPMAWVVPGVAGLVWTWAARREGQRLGSDRGVVCGIDSGVDDGALCPGPSDHPGYDADLLDYGGVGLSGAKGDENRQPKGGFPFLFVHGIGILGQGTDGVGGAGGGRSGLDLGRAKRGPAVGVAVDLGFTAVRGIS